MRVHVPENLTPKDFRNPPGRLDVEINTVGTGRFPALLPKIRVQQLLVPGNDFNRIRQWIYFYITGAFISWMVCPKSFCLVRLQQGCCLFRFNMALRYIKTRIYLEQVEKNFENA